MFILSRNICFFFTITIYIISLIFTIVNCYLLIRYSLFFSEKKNTELTWHKGYIFDLGQKIANAHGQRGKWPSSFLEDQGTTCSHHSFLKLGGRTYVIVEKIISHVNINYSNWFFLFIKKKRTQWLLDVHLVDVVDDRNRNVIIFFFFFFIFSFWKMKIEMTFLIGTGTLPIISLIKFRTTFFFLSLFHNYNYYV